MLTYLSYVIVKVECDKLIFCYLFLQFIINSFVKRELSLRGRYFLLLLFLFILFKASGLSS